MVPDIESAFGSYAPDSSLKSLIIKSQNAPKNFLGRQFAKWVRGRVMHKTAPPSDVEVGELRLRCYFNDNYTERKYVFMPWRFDKQEREIIFAALPRDGVFVDIGANVGVYTLEAATRLSSRGRVLAIEPYPPLYQRLSFNIAATADGRKQWPQITTLAVGVADEEKSFDLYLNQANLGQNSIRTNADAVETADVGQSISIACRPLLSLLHEANIEKIDVLKIDIEGAEDMALCPFLQHASQDLLPKTILMEDSKDQWERDLPSMLKKCGYVEVLRTRMNVVYQLRMHESVKERVE